MKFKYIYLIITAFVIVAAASCKKDLTNVNTSPTSIPGENYDPNFLLTTVQLMYTGSTNFGGSAWATKWGGVACFVQHTASVNTTYYYGDKYLNNTGYMGEMFHDSYTSEIQPVVELYRLTLDKPQYRNLHQMARIMKAMAFQQITDLYGDIPYFQAGLGYYERIYTPAYDKQEVIYPDLLKEVSQAVDSLSESADKPSGDILYSAASDQIGQWKKFGNSLLVRMAMRLSKVDATTAQTFLTKAAANTMKSNDDNAIVQFQDGNQLTQNRDAIEIFGNDSADLKLSWAFINNMKINHDPRLPVVAWIYATNGNGGITSDDNPADQIGMPSGYIAGGNNPAVNIYKIKNRDSLPRTLIQGYSRLNNNILNTTAPSLILTYAETELLLADAAKRWGIGGDAATHYKNGVLAAVTQLSVYGSAAAISDADANAYYNSIMYNDANALEQINTQYWLCTLMDEYESWSNWRRTGYPILKPVNYPGNVTNGTIPRRLTYPPDQKINNLANYNAAVAQLTGGDNMTSRVWWDTK